MRVTWLCLEWPRTDRHAGGVGRYVERLAEQMRHLVDLRVVAFEGARPLAGVAFDLVKPATSRLDRYYAAPWRASRAVRIGRPDLIHVHGDDVWLPRGVPVVRTFYGSAWSEAVSSTGLRRLNHVALALVEALSAHRADVRLGLSPESAARFRCHEIVPPYFAGEGPAGAAHEPSREPTVAFIGSFEGRKQGRLVQEAVDALRRSSDVRLVVVGPSEDRSRWASWVDHRSGLSDAEVHAVLASAWVLAAPSSYEGFGIPVLEAFEHGLRVVAFRNPGTEYLAQRGPARLPLLLTDRAAFGAVLAGSLLSPDLTPQELSAARRLVHDVAEDGSAARLHTIYQGILA